MDTIETLVLANRALRGLRTRLNDVTYTSTRRLGLSRRLFILGYPTYCRRCPVVDTWYHLAVVRSGDTLSIYVNGSETITTDCTGLLINSSDTGVAIGRATTNLDGLYFNGYMDEFRITKGQAL